MMALHCVPIDLWRWSFDCAVLFHLALFCRSKRLSAQDAACGQTGRFLVILCEPIGSYRAETLSAEFRRDLEDGINEQIFTDEEYAQMFDAAGLVATRAVIAADRSRPSSPAMAPSAQLTQRRARRHARRADRLSASGSLQARSSGGRK